MESYVGIAFREVVCYLGKGFLHILHILIGLLDDGEGNCSLPLREGQARLVCRDYRDGGEIPQLQQPFSFLNIDILDILYGAEDCRDAYIVFVVPVADHHASGLDVIVRQSLFDVFQGDAGQLHLRHVGDNLHLLLDQTGYIDHRHLG